MGFSPMIPLTRMMGGKDLRHVRDVKKLRLVTVCFLITSSLFAGSMLHYILSDYIADLTSDMRTHSFRPNTTKRLRHDTDIPSEISRALEVDTVTGYLLGNSSGLEFHPYPTAVDLRIIVLAFNRPESLQKCLDSIQKIDHLWDKVAINVWIDRDQDNTVHNRTLNIAHNFKLSYGSYDVHVQPYHVGIQGQWTNTWRPRDRSDEIAVILEDDMDVSPFAWRWLKAVHGTYGGNKNISGFSLSHPGIAHETGQFLNIPKAYTLYTYPVICTWGFSPSAENWRLYQDWFYKEAERNSTFLPLVPNILPSKWFEGERQLGRERLLWEMWHIYFTYHHGYETLMLNSHHVGLLAVNRHEAGVHDGINNPTGATEQLCDKWYDWFTDFPEVVPQFGFDGRLKSS